MRLTPYGRVVWAPISLLAAVGIIVTAMLGIWWGTVPFIVVWLFVANFFRDPSRKPPADLDDGDLLSPADGVISAVEQVEHHAATDGPAVIIRIFLNVLNVHVNRAPCDATVTGLDYQPGRFHDARTPESAIENESNLIAMRDRHDRPIGVRQVAGKVARRIVCPLHTGSELLRGERFGMIRFGSTTELILPDPERVDVRVSKGQKVRGGLTVLARMPAPTPAEDTTEAAGVAQACTSSRP